MIHREMLEQALEDVQEVFPDAVLEDFRDGEDAPELSTDEHLALRATLPPIGKTTLARMKDTARAEALRIECTQGYLVNSGAISTPSDKLIQRRDDFEGMTRLCELLISNADLRTRVLKGLTR